MVKIGLDCGHGLKTAGKQTPNGIKEWILNDKVRDKIVYYLKDYDVDFVFTDNDEGNTDEALSTRVKRYINEGVDVFVSIHHNALSGKWNNATGVEVFVDRNNTTKDMELANMIYKNLPAYIGLKGRGIKKENWYVINQNKIPAVLVEGGFMDSNIDYPIITSEKGQDGYARAVAEGLIEFLKLQKRQTTAEIQPKPAETIAENSYLVKINTELNVRAGAGTNYDVTTKVKKNEVYTIVEEKLNGSTKWGKLKSGAGWISLKFATKIKDTINTPYYPACKSNHVSIVAALKSVGVDSSFTNRIKIAQKNNVRDYKGTATQNNQLLAKLKAGRLFKI